MVTEYCDPNKDQAYSWDQEQNKVEIDDGDPEDYGLRGSRVLETVEIKWRDKSGVWSSVSLSENEEVLVNYIYKVAEPKLPLS